MIEPTQVESLLDEALPKSPSERAAYLDHACDGNRDLRQEVERLLSAHPHAEDFLGRRVTPDGLVLTVVGQADLKAANGDHLFASFTGSINLATQTATLTFEWTGGDGRFAHATGATVWQISLNPDLTYSAVADGVIKY